MTFVKKSDYFFKKLFLLKNTNEKANKSPIQMLFNIFAKGIVIKTKSININKSPSFVLVIIFLKSSTIFE